MCNAPINWRNPPKNLFMTAEEIHIYKANLNCMVDNARSFYLILSDDERQRAAQYKFETDRLNFVLARGILREIIGHYLIIKPKDIVFSYTSFGKPYLAHNILNFNLSHAGSLVVYILANSKKVGIDIEKIHSIPEFLDIAKKFFSLQENLDLDSISKDKQLEAFFRCWTRKEAFVKAIGNGLSFPLNKFDVTLLPHDPPRIININNHNIDNEWSMCSMNPTYNYEGAFSFSGPKKNVKIFYFNWK